MLELSGLDRVALYAHTPDVPEALQQRIEAAALRRVRDREPLQYITGQVEFCGMRFSVAPGVLVPRPETEFLVQWAVRHYGDHPGPAILDLCTGSGAIAIAVAASLRHARVTASDVSAEALRQARQNASAHELDARICFVEGDLFEPLAGQRFDLILSNPPYISRRDMTELAAEILLHEPHLALEGGLDGLDFYRRITHEAPQHLLPGGRLAMELGAGQAPAVRELCTEAGLSVERTLRDLAGHERILIACAA